MASLKVIQGSKRNARARSRFLGRVESEKQTGAKVGRRPNAAPLSEESQMSTRSSAVSQWQWVTTPTHVTQKTKLGQWPWHWVTTATKVAHQTKPGQHEVWAGAGYLLVWRMLWLAVIVTVLGPLDALFGAAR